MASGSVMYPNSFYMAMFSTDYDKAQLTCSVFQLFAYAAKEHSDKFKSTPLQLAKISHKNHLHSVNNPYACIRKEIPLENIVRGQKVCEPFTMPMCAPTADGSAAAILCSEDFMISHGLQVSVLFNIVQRKFSRSSFTCLDFTTVAMAANTGFILGKCETSLATPGLPFSERVYAYFKVSGYAYVPAVYHLSYHVTNLLNPPWLT